MRNKVTNILESGRYKNKNDIYQKVFSEEELNEIKKSNEDEVQSYKEEEEKKDSDFFLTQDNK